MRGFPECMTPDSLPAGPALAALTHGAWGGGSLRVCRGSGKAGGALCWEKWEPSFISATKEQGHPGPGATEVSLGWSRGHKGAALGCGPLLSIGVRPFQGTER